MDIAYWNPELNNKGGGGLTQSLKIEGNTLSLIPDGGSVQLPTGIISSVAINLQVSTVVAHDSI